MIKRNIKAPQATRRGLAVLATTMFAASLNAQLVSTVISSGLSGPNYVTVDQNNVIYFTDSSHNRIVKFNPGTTNSSILAGSAAGKSGTNNGPGSVALFSQPLGIVYDTARTALIVVDQANSTIRQVTTAGVVTTIAGSPPSGLFGTGNNTGNTDGAFGVNKFNFPVGIASDGGGNLYIADAGNSAIRVMNAGNVVSTIAFTNVVMNGAPLANYTLDKPSAVAFDPATRNLYIADTLHQTICLITNITTTSVSLTVIAGTPGLAGTNDSSIVSSALFNKPQGLLWDTVGGLGLLIGDTGNDTIRELTGSLGSGYVITTIAGSPSVPGLLDGLPGASLFNQPVGMTYDTKDGGYYVMDRGNNAMRSLVIVPPAVIPVSTIPPETTPVDPPTFTPNAGYFTNCVTIVVNAGVPDVYYTLNGTPPANGANVNASANQVTMTNNPAGGFEGSFQFCNAQQNLSIIQMVAINGTNFSTIATGQPPNTNTVGVPFGKLAGAGSTAIVPIIASLKAGVTLESIQFRVEFATNGNAPALTNITVLPIGTNDFLSVVGPVPGNLPFTYQTAAQYSVNGTAGIAIQAAGGTNVPAFSVSGNAVLALLEVTIPTNAVQGQSYTVSVLNPSGTSDGIQSIVGLQAIPSQTLTVSNVQYFVGDTSPGSGYSAGEFGDGLLDNSDVNNALLASVGIKVPYPNTDAFNAMDAYPPDTTGSQGGDGFITMGDWETILSRSLGLDTNNWVRFWTNSAAGAVLTHQEIGWTNGIPTPIGVPNVVPRLKSNIAVPPGQVWVRNGAFKSGQTTANGSTGTIAVSLSVAPGSTVNGMQFRAVITSSAGAPAPTSVTFSSAAGIPNPSLISGGPANGVICVWPVPLGNIGGLDLQGNNLLGTISFQIPAGANAQSYGVQFVGSDGMLNLSTEYQMESIPFGQITSDEWRMHFFGSTTSALAQDNADADGDGVPNWAEFLAGTDPTSASSALKFTSMSASQGSLNVGWLTAPGISYVVESSPSLANPVWTPVTTTSGNGYSCQISVGNPTGSARFYRIQVQ